MSKVFEARYYGDPSEVAAINELKANAAAEREYRKLQEALAKRAEQQRIRAKVMKGKR